MARGRRRTFRDLPGEAELDPELVRRSSVGIRALSEQNRVSEALRIGQRLWLDFFSYDGLPILPQEVARLEERHVSWQEFLANGDHGCSAVYLQRCLGVAMQHDALPPDARDRLTFTHLRDLARVPDTDAKRKLAERAVDERWTTIRLEEEVAAWRAEHRPRRTGRPPKGPHRKKADAAQKRLTELAELLQKRLPPPGQRGWLREQLQAMTTTLHSLAALLADEGGGVAKHEQFKTLATTTPPPREFPSGNERQPSRAPDARAPRQARQPEAVAERRRPYLRFQPMRTRFMGVIARGMWVQSTWYPASARR